MYTQKFPVVRACSACPITWSYLPSKNTHCQWSHSLTSACNLSHIITWVLYTGFTGDNALTALIHLLITALTLWWCFQVFLNFQLEHACAYMYSHNMIRHIWRITKHSCTPSCTLRKFRKTELFEDPLIKPLIEC